MSKDSIFSSKNTLNLNGKLMDLTYPVVMGILNITPDSFFADSRASLDYLPKIEKMLSDGASIIDIGGYSSRPGADAVSLDEEIQRVIPVIQNIKRHFPDIVLSIDTFRSDVAYQAVNEGVSIINDISAGSLDPKFIETVAQLNVPYILMHMKGNPQTMMQMADYKDVILEMVDFFQQKVFTLRKYGIKDIVLDPGFGFAKTVEHNYAVLRHLELFKLFHLPILAGVSRKSMIYKKLDTAPEEALNGTSVIHAIALMNNVNILRVHDVKEAVEAIKLYKATYN